MKPLIPACLTTSLLLCLFSNFSLAQERLQPTLKDISYGGDDPAQMLDVYLAKSEQPTPVIVHLHGGGWRGGSKNNVPAYLLRAVEEGWTSVVSVEYRFTDVETHPAQVNDCMRAIQFLRSQAEEWNIDPTRLGVTGGSAGGHLTLWIALHDDIANPRSSDPVHKESSRVSCAVGFAGPTDWSLLGEIEHPHPAYRQLIGYAPGTPAAEMAKEKLIDVSPISFASKDDPPVLIVHGDADSIVPVEHGKRLQAALDRVSADSELLIIEGGRHDVAGAGDKNGANRATAFFKAHLLDKDSGKAE